MLTGSANVGDSLAVLDTLVYKEKKYTMDEMLAAIDPTGWAMKKCASTA